MKLLARLVYLAAACALLITTFAIIGPHAVRAAVATLVQDRDQEGRNIYQATLNCSDVTNPCQIVFPAVPAGQRLIIKHVSVLCTMPVASSVDVAELRGGTVFQFLPLTPVPANFGGEFQYTSNEQVLAAYNAGDVPNVDVFAPIGGSFTVLASISGYTVTIP